MVEQAARLVADTNKSNWIVRVIKDASFLKLCIVERSIKIFAGQGVSPTLRLVEFVYESGEVH